MYEKTQNFVNTITIALVSVAFKDTEVSSVGRYFPLAAYGECQSCIYGFSHYGPVV
jgi:hypothetical protein